MLDSPPGEFAWGEEGKIIRCPWHGRQFDIETGRAIQDPKTQRVRVYPVWLEDDLVVIDAGGPT
jgi:3-phenylpropionate/trans-cinnamate dioxygenase ferredoxin subunit